MRLHFPGGKEDDITVVAAPWLREKILKLSFTIYLLHELGAFGKLPIPISGGWSGMFFPYS